MSGEDGLQGCCQGERTRQSDSGGSGSGRKIAQNYFLFLSKNKLILSEDKT